MAKRNGNGIRITNKEFFDNMQNDIKEIKELLQKIKEESIKACGERNTISSKQRLHEKMILGAYGFCMVVLGFLIQRMMNGGL